MSSLVKRPRLLLLGIASLMLCAIVLLTGRRLLPAAPVLPAIAAVWLLVSGLILMDRARR